MVTDALQTLDNMVYAAEGQLERAREEDQVQPHDRAEREVADLEMLIELASKQRAQYNERVGGGAQSSLLEPLSLFGNVLARSVTHSRRAYGRRSPSDAFERVRRVEVLGLATVGSERCERRQFRRPVLSCCCSRGLALATALAAVVGPCACHHCVCVILSCMQPVPPNLLPVAPTNAAHGLAGLGVLGVETVDTGRAGGHACICRRRQRLT